MTWKGKPALTTVAAVAAGLTVVASGVWLLRVSQRQVDPRFCNTRVVQ